MHRLRVEVAALKEQVAEVTGGASLLARDGCVVRSLASSAHALTRFARAAWGLARHHLVGLPPLDLRLD